VAGRRAGVNFPGGDMKSARRESLHFVSSASEVYTDHDEYGLGWALGHARCHRYATHVRS